MLDLKLEAEGKNLAVVECTENDYVKDYNENLIESPSQKPEYWCKQNNHITSQALVQNFLDAKFFWTQKILS